MLEVVAFCTSIDIELTFHRIITEALMKATLALFLIMPIVSSDFGRPIFRLDGANWQQQQFI
jgi:hypothetical protein